jgi:indole-3-glycerol phosphate synthase
MNFLRDILDFKAWEVEVKKSKHPISGLLSQELYHTPRVSLGERLRTQPFGVIAEIKSASPSKGVIRDEFDVAAIGRSYELGGAAAISVLTDEKFFRGQLDHISRLRAEVRLPLLRKDFVIDPYQLHETKSVGADSVLLIVAALGKTRLADLKIGAEEIGLEPFVEVHDESELSIALDLGCRIIGVNNRDLVTFQTSLDTSVRLGRMIPRDRLAVSESGIGTAANLGLLQASGFRAALIGESLIMQPDPGGALKILLSQFSELAK